MSLSLMELGAIGEFVGAFAVIATLAYLAIQIRQNTRAMEESRRLALAETYQIRANALQNMMVQAAESNHIGLVITKLTEAGYPEDVSSLDALSATERGRFRQWQIAQQTHWDNMFYQYQQGFLDDEYYRDEFRMRVRRLAPIWRALRVNPSRQSFEDEIENILAEPSEAMPDGPSAPAPAPAPESD